MATYIYGSGGRKQSIKHTNIVVFGVDVFFFASNTAPIIGPIERSATSIRISWYMLCACMLYLTYLHWGSV